MTAGLTMANGEKLVEWADMEDETDGILNGEIQSDLSCSRYYYFTHLKNVISGVY